MGALFEILFNFLIDLLCYISVVFLNLLIDLVNSIIIAIAAIMGVMIGFLPSPTFDWTPPDSLVAMAGFVSWFAPLGTMVVCLGIVAAATAAYFAIRPVLKFVHLT